MDTIKFLKLLFCFKKPAVQHLSYVPLFVKNKPALLVVWEIQHAWKVKLLPLKRSCKATKKALLISIPADLEQLTFKAVNYWRKTTVLLTLHPVALDAAAADWLISGYRPLNKLIVAAPLITGVRNRITVRPVRIQPIDCVISTIDRFNMAVKPIFYP